MIRFYDTTAILLLGDNVIEDPNYMVSSLAIKELERIKGAKQEPETKRLNAKKFLSAFGESNEERIARYDLKIEEKYLKNNILDLGAKECATAKDLSEKQQQVIYITNSVSNFYFAKSLGLSAEMAVFTPEPEYLGYKEVVMNDDTMADFYECPFVNSAGMLKNQYLIIKNTNDEVVDVVKWNGERYVEVKPISLKTEHFGTIKPYKGDILQRCAIDSFSFNKLTMIKGRAGTGKSYLALGYLFYLLDKYKIDKIIIFCNTVATTNAAKLGFYPGDKDDKLLDSSIGNMLSSKLGGMYAVNRLIDSEKLLLLPMSDIRGFDTTGMNAGVYITEAQNMDITLMKLALQRIGDDCICIIDGDYNTQVDLQQYSGSNNGMIRLSEVFRGQDFYGEIELKNIYRSKIAEIADKM